VEIKTLEADRGRYLGYVRAVGRRRADMRLEEPIVSVPSQYTRQPLIRGSAVAEPGAAPDPAGI
jgi:hypothetical protein